MTVNNLIKSIFILSISLLIGFGIGYLIFNKKESIPTPDFNTILDSIKIESDRRKIDSLIEELSIKESYIVVLKDSIKNIRTIKYYKIDSIRNLPTTEGVEFLRSKLREFESKY